ncbi:ExbD/TolR family protein [Luteolibacter marinus]|uniref:ExbD/TolR family protein n=1 Tax=Luteolibacter marinus TaxID=2776705 RepID=UPI001868D9C7|nr:biopolymer transporter ExbD [Luteolibacter marinus]
MKLESTLPERPGFLFVVPAFNLFALLLVFFLLGPSFVSQSGVAVELPVSRFQLERQAFETVVTVRDDGPRGVSEFDPPTYWLEHEQVTLGELAERLDARRSSDTSPATTVLLRVDKGVPVEIQREVAEIALQKGLRVYLLGRPEGSRDEPEATD